MAPAEVELKDGWAIGLKPEERKKIINPGKQDIFQPVHNIFLRVFCLSDDTGINLEISDNSLQIGNVTNESSSNSAIGADITFGKGKAIHIKTRSGQEVAVIKHIPAKNAT